MSLKNTISSCLIWAFAFALSSLDSITTGQTPIEPPPAKPVFKNGQAQRVRAFGKSKEWIRHDLWVETEFDSDGDGKKDRMHVDVTRQKQTDTEGLKVPVIYETSPYYCGIGTTDSRYFWNPRQELGEPSPERNEMPAVAQAVSRPTISSSLIRQWIPRGFAVVHSCSPGTGLSQGCPTMGGDNEALAPKAVIDWLGGRAKGFTTPDGDEEVTAYWCTGKVGMIGTSFNGTLPVAAATTGVEGLECIIPVAPNTSYYRYYRSNGLVRHPGGYMGEDIDVLYDFVNSGDIDRRDHCNCEVRDKTLKKLQDRVAGDYNEFWASRSYLKKLDNYRAPTLVAHAFNDWNVMPEHSVLLYLALQRKGVPVRCYFHQGGHGGDPPMATKNRWFSHYLYGIENGIENDEFRAWIVREGDRNTQPTGYADYPHPKSLPVRFRPQPGPSGGNRTGELTIVPPPKSVDEVDPVSGVDDSPAVPPMESLTDDFNIRGRDLAKADHSENRLLYVLPELQHDLHLSGFAKIKIRLACDRPAANLSVWVVSLPWIDSPVAYKNIITRGWADPQNHASLEESEPLEPGKYYELEFDLQPDDQVIPAGQKIGLMIFSSDKDFTLHPSPGTRLSIDLSHTELELPVVGGATALRYALGQPEPPITAVGKSKTKSTGASGETANWGPGEINSQKHPNVKGASLAAINRFLDYRIGLSVHWGPSSIKGGEISWDRSDDNREEYDDLYKKFNPESFDADQWCRHMKNWGMAYVAPTAKHHDGFALWFSKVSPYDMEATPYRQDIMAQLRDACKKHGIGLGTYYSNLDWYHADWPAHGHGGPGPLFPKRDDSPNMERYLSYMRTQCRELIEEYDVEFIQFDGEWDDCWTHEIGAQMYRDLRAISPSVLLSGRISKSREWSNGDDAGDYLDRERVVNHGNDVVIWGDFPWQAWVTLDSTQWSFKEDPVLHTSEYIITDCIHVLGNNGNYMINVPPMPNGQFPPEQVEIMNQFGEWIRPRLRAIRGTRGGPWRPVENRVYFTHKNDRAWAFIETLPENGQLKLVALDRPIASVFTFEGDDAQGRPINRQAVGFKRENDTWVIDTSNLPEPTPLTILEISFGD